MPRDVFISYQHEDQAMADRVRAALEERNISCWIAPRDIPASQPWATSIVEGIRRCHTFVVILSSKSAESRQMPRELELADATGLPIVSFRIEDVQPPPDLLFFLTNVQWVDAFKDQFDGALTRLSEAIMQSKNYPAPRTVLNLASDTKPATPRKPFFKRFRRAVEFAAVALLAAGIGSGTFLKVKEIKAHDEFQQGEKYFQAGDLRSALHAYDATIEDDRTFYGAYCERARVRQALGQTKDALKDLRVAIGLHPQWPFALELQEQFRNKPGDGKLKEFAERQF